MPSFEAKENSLSFNHRIVCYFIRSSYKNISLLKNKIKSLTFHVGKLKVGHRGSMHFFFWLEVSHRWSQVNGVCPTPQSCQILEPSPPSSSPLPIPNTSTGKETSVNPLALLQYFTAVITTDTKRRMFSSPKFLRYFFLNRHKWMRLGYVKNTSPGQGYGRKMKRNHDPQITELSLGSDLSFLAIQPICPNPSF